MPRRNVLLLIIPAIAIVLTASIQAQPEPKDPYAQQLAKASNDWKKTIKRMKLPAGVTADLWAAEPMVANIVAFAFDQKGRCYVAETFRLHHGVTDNRSHRNWLDDDLACRTVADRVAMYKKHLKGKFPTYEKDQDRIRLLEDTKGQGRADKSTIFADGFKNAADGIGSGVLARHGKVWFTCIPDLWLLQDTTGTGHANVKKSLHTGYGVHVSFLGHDMHGLRMGPDGKLYFSIGDRGLHVETAGQILDAPDTGSVLRCNPDGSELELFATGLRNPQELAFDEVGNLFTCDNNADGGDKARCVYLVEGGNSGWQIGFQYMPSLGPWNAEKLWHTQPTNTASYLLPPLAHVANGPSGFTYHPGVSLLPKQYQKHFFLCDFRGSGGGSGVHAFSLHAKGASFEFYNRGQFIWSVLATDCDFGPDGGFYVSDWVEGWGIPNKGRIYKFSDPKNLDDLAVKEVKTLLAEGFGHRHVKELVRLLHHNDQRIRQEAQFALVEQKALSALAEVAKDAGLRPTRSILRRDLARLRQVHAIWGLGQLGRKDPKAYEPVLAQATDADPEVGAQALKVLGDGRVKAAAEAVIGQLAAKEPRVRFQAALAAGRIGDPRAIPAVLALAKANNDADPYLRHAAVMALVGIGDKDAIRKAAADVSPAVRMVSLQAMRRLAMPEVAGFLNDVDGKLVLEAARAIYDVPIPAALPKLAALSHNNLKNVPERAVLRVLAANNRLGTKDNAHALVTLATRADVAPALREQALKMLQAWEKPAGRDWVVGLWRPLPERPASDVAAVLRPALAALMTSPDKVRTEAAKLAARHGMKEIGPTLRGLVADKSRPAGERIESLKALETLKDAQLEQTAQIALADADPRLRHQGRRIVLHKTPPADAVRTLVKVLADGAIVEQQGAVALLAGIKTPEADAALERSLDQVLARQTPPAVVLDVLLAAEARSTPGLKKKLAAYQATRDKKNPTDAYRESLVGGDAEAGRKIFFDKTEVSCLRCHKIHGLGGEVGPDLTGIGTKQKRDYLLEAIVVPNKQIAKGYESVVLTLASGLVKTGILKSEDAKEVRIMTAEGQLLSIPKADIDERARGQSAMPSDLIQKLTRSEVRDLVEFLASLRR